MNLREKRKQEQEEIKKQRMDEVIDAALRVFIKQGIDKTKMTDIADEAEIGVASVYRYFKTKSDIAIEAANRLWQTEIGNLEERYKNSLPSGKNGREQVTEGLLLFLEIYQKHTDFLKFLDEFDRYIVKEQIVPEKMEKYEGSIIDLKSVIIDAIESGKSDGSIRQDLNSEVYYFSVTHALMALSQKLALRGSVLTSDELINGEQQLQMILDMAIRYL
jgi:AcrR family transcriptional regulator